MVIGRSVVTGFLNDSVLLYLLSGTISSVFRVWNCRRISCTLLKKKKKRKKEIHSFWRYIGILLFDFFTLHFKKDTLFNGYFNVL